MDALPPRPSPPRSFGRVVRDWITYLGVARLVTGAVSVVAVVLGGWWLVRPPAEPAEVSLPYTAGAGVATSVATSATADAGAPSTSTPVTTAVEPATSAPDIVVHVAGAVVAPGVYRLRAGARVVDAVAAAGGATPGAQSDAVNLAAPLADGDRVYVPTATDATVVVPPGVTPSAGAGPATGGSTPSGPIDLNRATADELDALPGVGPSTAQAIVDHRDRNGPFASVDDLGDVRGIGPAKLEALRPLVTV